MPIFMDRHNAHGATHAELAEAHRLDLAAQEKYHVQFLGAWFDPELSP